MRNIQPLGKGDTIWRRTDGRDFQVKDINTGKSPYEYNIFAKEKPLGGKKLPSEEFPLTMDTINAQFTRDMKEGQAIRNKYVNQLAVESDLEEKRLREEEREERVKDSQ